MSKLNLRKSHLMNSNNRTSVSQNKRNPVQYAAFHPMCTYDKSKKLPAVN